MLVDGTWSGLLTDVEGHTAQTLLQLEQVAEHIEGRISLQVVTEDKVGAEQRGLCEGDTTDRRLVVRCKLDDQIIMTFDARMAEVRRHAKAALIATYSVEGKVDATLVSGVAIFWKYGY